MNTNETDSYPKAYGGYANDTDILMSASSGGIFMLIARKILLEGGVVAGAAMDPENAGVIHIIIDNVSELPRLAGSKYVRSDIRGIFPRIKEHLASGRRVLFSGTPCQVTGLKNYLGQPYDNLLCIDIICHGVPEQKVWTMYRKYLDERFGSEVTSVNFRDKKRGWVDFGMGINFKNGYRFTPRSYDPFFRLFLGNYVLHPSCYECAYKGLARSSDITLGDFWCVNKVAPHMYNRYGSSIVLIHNAKGLDHLNGIDASISPIDLDKTVKYASALVKSAKKPSSYDDFKKDMNTMKLDSLADKYCPVRLISRLYNMLSATGLSELLHRRL